MNTKLSTTTFAIAAVSATISLSQPAMAEGNRFDYAPNIYRLDAPNVPKSMIGPAPIAHAGQAPRNMLGLTPELFAKPAPAPVPQPAPAAAPPAQPGVIGQLMNNIGRAAGSFTKPVPLAAAPAKSLPQYRSEFGTPLEVKPPVVASQPQTPGALSAPAKSNSAKPSSAPRIAYNHSGNVHGVLRHPGVMTGKSATAGALPQIASYAPGVGYASGPTLPHIGSGSGQSTSTHLTGVMIPRHH